MNTTQETITPNRPFVAGFWLIAVIPVYIPIMLIMMEVFDLDFESLPARFAFFLVHLAGGYLWARSLSHRSGLADNQLMNISGGLAFATMVIWLFILPPGSALQKQVDRYLEMFVGKGNLEFGAIFAPWIGLIAGISGLALGLALKKWGLGLKMFGLGFFSGLFIYLVIMFTMQLLGFKVGSGRWVMLPTTFMSMWFAALVGSALFGRELAKSNYENE
jgi:hypothetical protein